MKSETLELARVSSIGAMGWFATIKLVDIATIGSICVAAITTAYVGAKLYYLIKNGGKSPE